MSICRVISFVVGRGCLLWPVYFLEKTLLAFALLHFLLHSQTYLLLLVSHDFLLLHSSPLWWKEHLFLVLVLEGGIGIEPFNFSFFGIIGWDIDLNYCDIEWFALETKIILLFLKLHPSTTFRIPHLNGPQTEWMAFPYWRSTCFQ